MNESRLDMNIRLAFALHVAAVQLSHSLAISSVPLSLKTPLNHNGSSEENIGVNQ